MSRNTIIVLIYHRHKILELINIHTSSTLRLWYNVFLLVDTDFNLPLWVTILSLACVQCKKIRLVFYDLFLFIFNIT
jgi:hypothetical protein